MAMKNVLIACLSLALLSLGISAARADDSMMMTKKPMMMHKPMMHKPMMKKTMMKKPMMTTPSSGM